MKNMKGKLYGIGVGPGDPELLTLKAVRIIKECDVIALPGKEKEKTVAYKIVKPSVPEIEEKQFLNIEMPMTKDADILEKSHKAGTEKIIEYLNEGKRIAFLTLGDPCVYSTYIYIHQRVKEAGYETEIISGIPSFCAASAKLGIGLAEKAEMIHIIPASYQIEEALTLEGTKILMKAGRKMDAVKTLLKKNDGQVLMVENCGMENEKVYSKAEEIPADASYYSLIVVKNKAEGV